MTTEVTRQTFFPEGMPLPVADEASGPFWAACREHRLVVQRCAACKTFRHSPEIICFNCRSFDSEWVEVSGRGVIYSFINVVHQVHPALRERAPFNVVLVELLDAGNVRMIGNVVDTPFEELHIGMPVEVVWEDTTGEVTQPRWRPVG